MNHSPQDSPLEPSSSIWSTSSTPQPPEQSFTPSSSIVGDSSDIWATVPSTSTAGYNPTYLSTPPPTLSPQPTSTGGLDEFDPYSPSSSSLQQLSHSQKSSTATLGSGVRKNSKLVLIDSDEEHSDHDDEEEQRLKAEKELLDSHEREKEQERLQRGKERGETTGWSVGNMFKSLSSSSTSPSTSRPSTPNQPSPLTRTNSSSFTSTPPPPQTNQSSASSPVLSKPFSSIASVFRSTPPPATSQPPLQSRPTSSSSSLLSAIAGKGKQRESDPATSTSEQFDEKSQSNSPSTSSSKRRRPPPTFDFNLFLTQMRSRPADPIAKYLRSYVIPPLSFLSGNFLKPNRCVCVVVMVVDF